MRHLLVLSSLVMLAAACSPRHSGQVSWTVDGAPAADGCGDLGDTVNVKVFPKTSQSSEAEEVEVTTADCTTGMADVALGNYSTVFVELLRGETVVGLGGPTSVQAQGGLVGSVNPLSGPLLVEVDIAVELGFLEVGFTVAQGTCDEAGLGNVTVQAYKQLVSLDREPVWEEPMTVGCNDGVLIENVEVGATYFITVEGDAGGTTFGTAGSGQRVEIRQPASATEINLIDISLD